MASGFVEFPTKTDAILAESVLTRLNRWSDNLPEPDPIPISKDEAYEVALFAAQSCRSARRISIEAALRDILAGQCEWRGHRVVVL